MERSSIFLIEPVPGIERQEFDLGSFGQIGRLVDDKTTRFYASLQCHVTTVAPGEAEDKQSVMVGRNRR